MAIAVRDADTEHLTAVLARVDGLQLDDASDQGGSVQQVEPSDRLPDTYADMQQRAEAVLHTLGIPVPQQPSSQPLQPRSDAAQLADVLAQAERAVADWQQRRDRAQAEARQLGEIVGQLRLLESLDVTVEAIRQVRYVTIILGHIPQENWARLSLPLAHDPSVIVLLASSEGRMLLAAATSPENAPILERILDSVAMERLAWPEGITGSIREVAERLSEKLDAARSRLGEIEWQRQQLADEWQERLLNLWQRAHGDADIVQMIGRYGRSGGFYLLTGLIPDSVSELVLELVHAAAREEHLIFITPLVEDVRGSKR
jgi:vacuolar-type H+-ATPase subunit I/STV1